MKKIMLMCLILLSLVIGGCSQEEETIKLGFVGTLSGQYAEVGLAEMYAVQIAVEEVNLSGGIDGKQVELYIKDDEADSEVAVEMLEELKELGINIVIGHSLSIVAVEAVEYANENGILLLSPSIGTDILTGIDDNMIRNVATVSYEGSFITSKIIEKGFDKVLIIFNKDNNVLTTYHVEACIETLTESGYTEADYDVIGFWSNYESDLDEVNDLLSTEEYDSVFIVSANIDASGFVNYIKSNNIDSKIYLTSWASTGIIDLIDTVDTTNIYAYINMDVHNTDPSYVLFRDKYLEYYGKHPDMVAINAYDLVYILKSAVEEVGSLNIDDLKDSIINSEIIGINSTYYIDQYGDNEREHIELIIQNGEFVQSE